MSRLQVTLAAVAATAITLVSAGAAAAHGPSRPASVSGWRSSPPPPPGSRGGDLPPGLLRDGLAADLPARDADGGPGRERPLPGRLLLRPAEERADRPVRRELVVPRPADGPPAARRPHVPDHERRARAPRTCGSTAPRSPTGRSCRAPTRGSSTTSPPYVHDGANAIALDVAKNAPEDRTSPTASSTGTRTRRTRAPACGSRRSSRRRGRSRCATCTSSRHNAKDLSTVRPHRQGRPAQRHRDAAQTRLAAHDDHAAAARASTSRRRSSVPARTHAYGRRCRPPTARSCT